LFKKSIHFTQFNIILSCHDEPIAVRERRLRKTSGQLAHWTAAAM